MTKKEQMIQMLETFVMIDSGSYDKSGVDRLGSLLIDTYRSIGYEETVYKQDVYGDHILLRQKTNTQESSILLLAHMDTVFPVGTAISRPFTIDGDYAYGPGVADMKGSHVTTFFALRELYETHPDLLRHIDVLLTSDEEIGAVSARPYIEQHAQRKKAVLVMEPARKDGSVVTFRRGGGRYTMKVEGIAAHSGNDPEKGASAIEELAHKIIALHQLSDQEAGIHVNVGVIKGGTSVNTVADYAEADIDIRISTIEQASELEHVIHDIAKRNHVAQTKTTVEGGSTRPPMVRTEETIQLYHLVKACGAQLGIEVKETASGGGSDASYTSALGVPTIDGMGPIGGGFHSVEEFLFVPSLEERSNLLVNVMKHLLTRDAVFG
ncbi:M20 family metallopeptidase [Shouchella sp. JSM 1781072]|uniref:M20 family metallopeptidase n=1 Tax=Shouchella sp. JSM 1781072 TaxID=3344581 RepID=UPI0035C0964B